MDYKLIATRISNDTDGTVEDIEAILREAFPAPEPSAQAIPLFDGQSFRAPDWAEAYCKRHPEADMQEMLGWFASAIMRGYDEAKREYSPPSAQDARELESAGLAVWIERNCWTIEGMASDVLGRIKCTYDTNKAAVEIERFVAARLVRAPSPSGLRDSLESAWVKAQKHFQPTCADYEEGIADGIEIAINILDDANPPSSAGEGNHV
jgi:hypothetical protein